MTELRSVPSDVDAGQIHTTAEFAQALTLLRHRAGRSIRQVARITGIPSATLGGYFSGRHLPPATQPHLLGQVLNALGVRSGEQVAQWEEALLRVRRGPARGSSADGQPRSAGADPSPYQGLEPFDVPDAALFYGREGIVDNLVGAVHDFARGQDPDRARLIMLVGPSGSGKSSVLRAGLVARLASTQADQSADAVPWAVSVLVPGADPLAALDAARVQVAGAKRALLVIDQAEEVFSPEVTADQRTRFIEALSAEAERRSTDRTVVVVVGLRADFYGQAAANPLILPALRQNQFLLGSMTIADLRRAIVQPAHSVGVTVDPQLVDLLLRDLTPRRGQSGYDAGALPLVSHAMLATWQHHTGDRLTVADYLAAGGIAGAVQQTAENVVAELDDSQRAAAQWLFAQLVTVDDEGVMTRRRVGHDALAHPDPDTDMALDPVIEAFVAGRLITASDNTLEVSHEALLTAWPRLRDWVLTDLEEVRIRRRISEAAAAWRERDQDPSALLRGGPLSDAQTLAAQPITSHRVLSAAEDQFVAASLAVADQDRAAERQRTNRLRSLLAVMTVLALLAGLLTVVSVRARNDARAQEQAATTARDQARSRQLAIAANKLRDRDRALGAQLALAAYNVAPTLQARSSLLESSGVPTPTRLLGPQGEMHATANSDGTVLAATGNDGVTRLWQGAVGQGYRQVGELAAQVEPQTTYATGFSPDGRLLAVSTAAGDVVLWDVNDLQAPNRVAILDSAQSSVQSVAFNPDGTRLAVGTSEPKVRLWDLDPAGGGQPQELRSITGDFGTMVKSVAYSPDGGTLATGSEDGAIALWSVPTDGRPALLSSISAGGAGVHVHGVDFSPDGTLLLSGGRDRVGRLWDLSDPSSPVQRPEVLDGFVSWVNSVAFSTDGSTVALGSSDGTVGLFTVADGQRVLTLPHPAAVNAVQFVAAGSGLLTSEIDGVGRLWPLPEPALSGFGDNLWSMPATADGSLLAIAPGTNDGSLHLFEQTPSGTLSPLTELSPPEGVAPPDGAAALSSDGQWAAVGTGLGELVAWERPATDNEFTLSGSVRLTDTTVQGVAIGTDRQVMVGAANDGQVGLWSLTSGGAPREIDRMTIPGNALNAAISPDSSLIAVPSSDGTVHLWQLTGSGAGTQVQELPPLTGFENYVYGITFDPSGQYLTAASTDRTVRIWDVTDPGQALPVGAPLTGPGDTVFGLSWAANGTLAAAVSDGHVWLWDLTDPGSPIALGELSAGDASLYSVSLQGGGSRVLAGGSAAGVVTWQTDPQAVAADICATTGSPITEAEWTRVAPGVTFDPPCAAAATD